MLINSDISISQYIEAQLRASISRPQTNYMDALPTQYILNNIFNPPSNRIAVTKLLFQDLLEEILNLAVLGLFKSIIILRKDYARFACRITNKCLKRAQRT